MHAQFPSSLSDSSIPLNVLSKHNTTRSPPSFKVYIGVNRPLGRNGGHYILARGKWVLPYRRFILGVFWKVEFQEQRMVQLDGCRNIRSSKIRRWLSGAYKLTPGMKVGGYFF